MITNHLAHVGLKMEPHWPRAIGATGFKQASQRNAGVVTVAGDVQS